MSREPVVSALEIVPFDGKVESEVDRLVSDIATSLRVFRTRDGFAIPETLILDRARNLACGLIGNWTFKETK